jgi:hypothetical protein
MSLLASRFARAPLFCGPGAAHCLDRSSLVWGDIQAAAEATHAAHADGGTVPFAASRIVRHPPRTRMRA